MKKTILVLAVALILGLAFGHSASAATVKPMKHSAASSGITGVIVRVNVNNNTIELKVGNQVRTYHFTGSTQFLNAGKHVKSMTVKRGDTVMVYANASNSNDIHRLDVISSAGK